MRLHDIIIFLWRAIWTEPQSILKILYYMTCAFFVLVAAGGVIALVTEAYAWSTNYLQVQKAYARMERIREQEADAREQRAQQEVEMWEKKRKAKERVQKAD